MFNLAIDSKLRGCNLVSLGVGHGTHAGHLLQRATIVQRKTGLSVRFELTELTRQVVEAWIAHASLQADQSLFATEYAGTGRNGRWP
jgi:hypothetical protein